MGFYTQRILKNIQYIGQLLVSSTDSTFDYLINKLVAGSGVTITHDNVGGNETLTISSTGGGGGATLSIESLSGTQDGTNKVFTVAHTPVFINDAGQIMTNGNGFSLSGLTVTFDNAPPASSSPLQNFFNLGSAVLPGSELVATGTVNGMNTSFTFTQQPTYIVSDGVIYKPLDSNGNTNWSFSVLTATMTVPPQSAIWGIA